MGIGGPCPFTPVWHRNKERISSPILDFSFLTFSWNYRQMNRERNDKDHSGASPKILMPIIGISSLLMFLLFFPILVTWSLSSLILCPPYLPTLTWLLSPYKLWSIFLQFFFMLMIIHTQNSEHPRAYHLYNIKCQWILSYIGHSFSFN